MALFFFVVAGLNLALGYALALWLAGEAQPQVIYLTEERRRPDPPVAAPVQAQPPAPAATASLSTIFAGQPAAPAAAEAPTIGASIAEFKQELSRYRDQLAAVDQRMRANSETQDAVAIKQCLTDLRSANDQYLEQHSQASDRFQVHSEQPEFEPIHRRLDQALGEQAEQVSSSNRELADVDLESDLLIGCRKLLDETSRLVDANHTMREALDDAELQLGRRGSAVAGSDDMPAEPQHNLVSRVQLEAALAACWQADPNHNRPLSVALVDLDRFRELNDTQGLNVGDRVLQAVAQLVGGSARGEHRAARLSAQKFLVLFTDMPAREATGVVERIRQQVEATQFRRDASSISVTVSCAVAESAPNDTQAALFERVEATLQEAKRYGRNRTFLHDGKFPAPVVPPVLPVETRTLAV